MISPISNSINIFQIYIHSEIIPFDGKNIPFEDQHFDFILCTEVLEHVEDFPQIVREMHRVLKNGGQGVLTVPWSARFHYIPYDFFRYTPTALDHIFKDFKEVQIKARGSDLTSIVAKIVVLFARVRPSLQIWNLLLSPIWVLMIPIVTSLVGIGHLSICLGLGSDEDPLGYTVTFSK